MKTKKLRVGILFGGRSPEHEVSIVSARAVAKAFDKKKFEIIPIGIDKKGKWLLGPGAFDALSGDETKNLEEAILPPIPGRNRLICIDENGKQTKREIDIIFPILHGTFGEDGTIQGLMELAEIPYVGCGVLGSALGMDKSIQKQVLRDAGLPVTPWLLLKKNEFEPNSPSFYEKVASLGMPVFVKPAGMGSSIGVHKVKDARVLQEAIEDAFLYDQKVLIEKAVPGGREIECAVLGGSEPRASVLGEIISSGDFYDYAAKYVDGKSKTIIPADLPDDLVEKMRKMAVRCFKALSCTGLARVDFLLDGGKLTPFINEINTMPGFTAISMFPKLWEASGTTFASLLEELINLSLLASAEKKALRRTYAPEISWWKKN